MSLVIKKIVNEPIGSNCFVIFDKAVGNRCIVIDPGFECPSAISNLFINEGLNPEYIILTHEHFDHCFGCIWLNEQYQTPVICTEACAQRISNAKSNLSLFRDGIGFCCTNETITTESIENRLLLWSTYNIQYINTKGHTDSGISILINDHLFTGDTLIKDLKTVTKLKCGSKEDLKYSLQYYQSLKGLGIHIHPGHGDDFDLDGYDLDVASSQSVNK